MEAIFNDKVAVRAQLKQGAQMGVFQPLWLEKFDAGTLMLYDYIALTTLQYQKITRICNLLSLNSTNVVKLPKGWNYMKKLHL